MKWGLEDGVIAQINQSLDSFDSKLYEVKIFGSRARGDFKTTSDIDLALTKHNLDFREFLKLKANLDKLPILYKIDILDFQSVDNQNLKKEIQEQGEVFYSNNNLLL